MLCDLRQVPSPLWAFCFPTCKTRWLDREPGRALPTCKCQVRGSGPFPTGFCAPFVPQPECWLVGAGCLFPASVKSTREQGGNLVKSQQTGQGPGTWHLLLHPVQSLLALPHMPSPGPEAGDSQGRARGLAPCFSIHRGSDCRNKAAGP